NATAGGQRHGIQSWSGDIFANWQIFKSEIPGLINYSAAGLPYFSTDTGGYWPTNYGAALPSYNELFVRWLQFSAFSSIMRVHGNTNNREPWRFPANEQDIIIDYIKLRERLIPYIYALAGQVTQDDYTMIRPLVFDFPGDNSVMHITDQYMFGPAMMVAPVTTQGAQERNVYLPEGQWIDFWTGEVTDSFGETVMADAPLSKIPVFVRAGSVLPMGPHQQYANEKSDPLEIRVYMGANGSFKLYEDEGNSYNYEDDRFSVIPFSWNQAAKTLTIGARTGSFDGMLQNRTFNIVFVQPGYGTGLDPAKAFQKSVAYTGAAQTVVFDPDWTLPLPELDTNLIPRPAPAPSAVPDNAAGQSMVGEWKFEDGNITTMAWDTSGYANTGFFKGGAAFGDPRPGGAGAALSLDGSGGYMSVPHAPSLDMTTGVTGSLWVNWQKDNTDYWYFMINKSGNANNNPGYCFLLSPQGVPQVELQTAKNGSGQTVKKTVAAASSIPQNTWVHLAFSWQSQSAGGDGIVRIYRDGTLVSADSAANRFDGPVGTNTSDLHIGVTDDMELNGGGWANYFRGRVSEIRLFNFGVTGEDVTKIMNGQAVVIPGPVNIRTTPGDGKITVDWSVPAGVSANIKGYTLTVESVNGAYSKTYPDVLMPYELTGLTNGEYYRIALKTLYHDGKESQNAYAVGIASPYPAEIRRLLTHDNKAYGFIVNHGSDPVKGTLNIFVYRDGIPVKITQIPNFTLTGLETKLFDADIGGFGTGQYVQAVFDDGYGELLAVSKATERDRIWPLAEMSQEQLTGYLNTLLNLPAPPVTFAADSVDRYNGYAAGILAGDYGLHDAIELLRTTRHFPVYRFVPGNVSGTGTLNINDARMVLQHLVEKITLTGLPLQAADVDGNGKVDITDARLILQMLVQKITEFPRKD
ncbi:MAG: DUF5110 domain-containing protein, partial [Oscillospiraceae bacterium]|nr:DUF5110 domain-containing protein [Oscillospiraceae bacterium]